MRFPFQTHGYPAGRALHGRRGFVLVAVLGIIALLVVVMLSISAVLQVENRAGGSARNQLIAQQNAILGLQLAMSQLQEYAGKDQAVTFPATTFYPTKDMNLPTATSPRQGKGDIFDNATYGYRKFASVAQSRSYLGTNATTYLTPTERTNWDAALKTYWNASRNPHWTGIMDASLRVDRATAPNSAPAALAAQPYESSTSANPTKYGEPKRDQLPVWLVSGNEQFKIDQASDTTYPSGYQTPDVALPDPATNSSVIYLVGEGSAATNSADGMDGRVKARKQELKGPSPSGSDVVTGHYAYWVGDESTKANFAARDRTSVNDSSYPNDVAKTSTTYRNRLQVPQRVGWENITGFTNATFLPNDSKLDNVSTSLEIGLLETDPSKAIQVKGAAKTNFHSLTAFSKSLLTDTALGGLKKDLTAYFERSQGLGDADTIANPVRYVTSDSRFRAWGGVNTGFPNTSAAALDGIPTWGQIKTWYKNEASGSGAGTINPSATTAPVLSYIAFHNGMSYDPATQRIRLHWLPVIVLWNPYDASLASATYDLEIGISPLFNNLMFVNESPTLAELQMDVAADWREITVPAGSGVNGPDGLPVLMRDGVTPYQNSTTGNQTIRIFKGTRSNLAAPGPTTRYFKQITPSSDTPDQAPNPPNIPAPTSADNFDMRNGPWPFDSNLKDGTTDAFGRFFYYVEPTDATVSVGYNAASSAPKLGALGTKAFLPRIAPHENSTGGNQGKAMALPVDRPLRFQVSAAFGPGEARIFTVPDDTQWSPVAPPVPLSNQFDPAAPASLWFDFLNVANGPDAASAAKMKRGYDGTISAGGIAAPTAKLSLGGKTIMESKTGLGSASGGGAAINARGKDLDSLRGYGDPSKLDYNNNGIINREEPDPAFVSKWRPVYKSGSDFMDHLKPQATDDTDAAIAGYGVTWLTPLLGIGETDLHKFLPALSRFNIMAKSLDLHPMVDAKRDLYGSNMQDYRGLKEGFTRLWNVQSQDQNQSKWDDNQYNGDLAYSLVLERPYTTSENGNYNQIRPLSTLAVRNARRANSEILSLGQFQQVNLSPYLWQPAFPIGNSDASPYTDREAIAGINSRKVGAMTAADVGFKPNNSATASIPGNSMMDLSYLLNENLWDRYFLSTITGTPNLLQSLPNSRLRFTANTTASDASSLQNFDTAAANLENFGALNVNSTSVEAWKALLTSFRNLKLESQSGQSNADNTVPVVRSLSPIEDKVNFTLSSRTAADYGNLTGAQSKDYRKMVSGFRFMDDAMIQALAERIVDEIRMRGPFLSLADFVNRRLVAPAGSGVEGSPWHEARTNGRVGFQRGGTVSELPNSPDADLQGDLDFMDPSYNPFAGLQGLNGTLQRAINLSGINGGVNHPKLGPNGDQAGDTEDKVFSIRIKNSGGADQSGGVSHWTSSGIGKSSNTSYHHSIEPSVRGHLDNEHIAGSPAGEAGQLFQGAPGFVTQGDLLAMIGPALTARGDTFLIRTYGDAVDPSGRVLARAYLEAVVQRVATPVKAAGTSGEDKWRPTDKFGRKFEIVKLRWLTPEDI